MIDTAHVRVPNMAPSATGMSNALEQLRHGSLAGFTPSRFYEGVGSLKEHFGIEAILHFGFRHGRKAHKIEIREAGKKSVQEMADIVTSIFNVDPWSLSLLRVDLTADVEGVPVPWFREHAFVSRKQFSSRIAKSFEQEVQFVGMGTAQAQTLYAGKRPNLIRIYDKLAEWRLQLRKLEREARRSNALMEAMELTAEQKYYRALAPPEFKEFCRARGYDYQTGNILTRIERQIGGDRFPPELATLGDLRYAHEQTPFAGLHLAPTKTNEIIDSPPEGVSTRNWLAALGFGRLKEQLGSEQLARSCVLKYGKGNGRRILESLEESIPEEREPLTMEEVQESFKQSTLLQTSYSAQWGVHLSPTYEHTEQIAGSRVRVLPQDGPYRWTAPSRESEPRSTK